MRFASTRLATLISMTNLKDAKNNSLVFLPPPLKQALRESFDLKYRRGSRVAWQSFYGDWVKNFTTEHPSNVAVRNLFKDSDRNNCEYRIAEGLCQLLLDCSYETWIEQDFEQPTAIPEAIIIPQISQPLTQIYQNLPTPDHQAFTGRTTELTRLLQLLNWESKVNRITIHGMGGIGKTALALEVAFQCNYASLNPSQFQTIPQFEAIIFVSAKSQQFTDLGIFKCSQPRRNLAAILRVIAQTLQCTDILKTDLEEQCERVQEYLKHLRTLLILDNLETLEDPQDTLPFILNLPPTVKVVITTREQVGFTPIHLDSLSELEGLNLIKHHCQHKQIAIADQEAQELYQKTAGIPLAIVYAVGQLNYSSLSDATAKLNCPKNEVIKYCLEGAITSLKGQLGYQILLVFGFFSQSVARETLAYIANSPDDLTTGEAIATLCRLSLVIPQSQRYHVLSVTRNYIIAELQQVFWFEQAARERWVDWYQKFACEQGSSDWKEWNFNEQLEKEWDNLQEVIEWCIRQNRYHDFLQFWKYVKGYTHFAGYWSERLDWMRWLIREAESRQDWEIVAEAKFDRGRTLILLAQPQYWEEAKGLFEQAWQLCQQYGLDFRSELALHLAVVWIEKRQFEKSEYWLEQARKILAQSGEISLKAELFYYQGRIHFECKNYDQARQFYQEAIHYGEKKGWQRLIVYSQLWLAQIEIAQGNFENSTKLLKQGLKIVENNKDLRPLAFCQQIFADLEQARGNYKQAQNWAIQAKQSFQNLGMSQESLKMEQLIQQLNSQL